MTSLPALFVSHGSPMLALEPGPTGEFLASLGPALDRSFGRPRAIIAISAHSTARSPVLLAADRHEAVHDFGGFPPALYTLRYDAPGAPALADDVLARLEASGHPAHRLEQGGLDHGIWSMLRFIYPDADVPVLPLAWAPTAPPAAQFALGEALAGLTREGVLVLGTGSITHNLRRVFARGEADVAAPEVPESAAFRQWFAARGSEADWPALFDYRRQAPHAVDMHPTDEHLLPWFVAAGAGGAETAPRRIFESVTYGCLGMDAYAFGPGAGPLQAALLPPQGPGRG